MEKPEYPIPFSLSFSLSGFTDPLPYELDQDPDRPDICLGADPYHSPDSLVESARRAVSNEGLTCRINRPYGGTIVPRRYYERDRRVSSIMIEVNRSLYMNEATGEKSAQYEPCKTLVGRIVKRLREGRPANSPNLRPHMGSASLCILGNFKKRVKYHDLAVFLVKNITQSLNG